MNVTIITIGDELLLGQVADTNSAFLARYLAAEQWTATRFHTVPDDPEAIRRAITDALASSQLILTTGGLGPTKDDITKQVLLDIFGGSLRLDASVLANVEDIFRRKGLTMNDLTRSQAMVPDSAQIIPNVAGTAPVMWFDHKPTGAVLVSMPGVPSETRTVFPQEVLPRLRRRFHENREIAHRTLMLYGISESDLAEMLDAWESALPRGAHLAYLPDNGLIRLRLDCIDIAPHRVSELASELAALCGPYILCEGDTPVASLLLDTLQQRHMMCAAAESCTGGNIARTLTSIPGASVSVAGGVVAYSNHVKQALLGVSADTLQSHGAVSEPVVAQMAGGVCSATGAALGIATSGIAGPSGGTPLKPVGTVCIGICVNGVVTTATCRFGGSRDVIVARATNAAIVMALKALRCN